MIFGTHINKYYKKYWYLFLIGTLCLLIVDIAQLLVPLLVGQMITALDPSTFDEFATMAIRWDGRWFAMTLGYVSVAIFIIGILITVGRIGWRLTVNRVGKMVECDLRAEMYRHIQTLSVSWFAKQKTGGLMAYFTNDLEDISACTSQGLIFLVDAVFMGLACLVFMFVEHWVLALVCLAPISAMVLCSFFIMKGETKRWNVCQQDFQNMSDLAQESISGLAVVKAFVREGVEMRRFAQLNGKLKLSNIRYFRFSQLTSNVGINILIYATVLAIMLVSGYFALTPDLVFPGIEPFVNGADAAGRLTEFFGYYSSLIWPLSAVTLLVDLTSRGKASLNRIGEILDTKSDLVDSENLFSGAVVGDIEYRHLSFVYPDAMDLPALRDISFTIRHGETWGVVGRTGSGKSSLLHLLLKLYNVEPGMLLVDGRDINEWNGRALRAGIGVVAQDAFLFSDTISGNIAFGSDHPTEESIRAAARFADVDENIRQLPQGYETLVGERGKSVSGGQRQRISMARAVIRDPAILILDDSVSAVDAITEKQILANIAQRRQDRTTLIISSRLSAVEHLDGVLVLDEGRLVGAGKHEDLLATCPIYHKMYELQALEREMN